MSENTEMAADRVGKWLSSPRSWSHETAKVIELVNRLNERGNGLSGDEQWDLVGEIADILDRYPLALYPMRGADAFPKSRQFLTFQLLSSKNDPGSQEACQILNCVRLLLEHGELWRVKFCRKCGNYFRATRRRSAWCSEQCENGWRQSDEQFKKDRADKGFKKYWETQMYGKTGKALREVQARRARAVAKREGEVNEKTGTGSLSKMRR